MCRQSIGFELLHLLQLGSVLGLGSGLRSGYDQIWGVSASGGFDVLLKLIFFQLKTLFRELQVLLSQQLVALLSTGPRLGLGLRLGPCKPVACCPLIGLSLLLTPPVLSQSTRVGRRVRIEQVSARRLGVGLAPV